MSYFDEPEEYGESSWETTRRTGFAENWYHSLHLAITEDLPIISRFVPSETESMRNKRLHDYHKQGVIPDAVFNFYGSDSDGLAHYARTQLNLEDVPTQKEYEAKKLEEYSKYRQQTEQVSSQAGLMGTVGQVAGSLNAMALDPLYASSFLTGYGGATTVMQAFLRVGAMEAGIEVLAQPFKMNWKEEIGADYGAADALTSVIFTGLGAGTLAGLGKALGRVLNPTDLRVKDALDFVEGVAKRNPEVEPIAHVLRNADPEEKLAKVLNRDEAIDITKANQSPPRQEFEGVNIQAEEQGFYARTSEVSEEGVQRRTPLTEEETSVYKADEDLKIIEECMV